MEAVFIRLDQANLRLNPKKCTFCLPKVIFLGYVIDQYGQRPDPQKIKAIKEFPTPTTITGIKSFVSLCSYYRKFVENFAKIAKPLTLLTKKDIAFDWGEHQEKAFQILKDKLTNPPVLAHFDPELPTEVRSDASLVGIGAILVQKHPGGWRPVAYVSRQLNIHEQNYTVSEKECLAIMFALEKFKQYLEGLYFKIVTNHCSLCFLKSKMKLPPRLMRWAMQLQEYHFDIEYKSGKHHLDVDCLSRYPVGKEEPLSPEEEKSKLLVTTNLMQDSKIYIREQQNKDPDIKDLKQQILRRYFLPRKDRKKLNNYQIINGIVYRIKIRPGKISNLVYLPKSLRNLVCKSYHENPTGGHVGQEATYLKIAEKYYWPRMFKHIKKYVASCHLCQTRKISHQGPVGKLQPLEIKSPFYRIGIDILGPLPSSSNNRYIIVCIDYFTKWVETKAVHSPSATVIARFIINQIFCRHGAPFELISDRGSNFTSEIVKQINKQIGIKMLFTTAYHPQTNGQTERIMPILSTMLSMYVNKFHSNWSTLLPMITFAYNTTPQSSIRMTPFKLLYGRDAIIPEDMTYGVYIEDHSKTSDYIRNMEKHWTDLRNLAKAAMTKAQENYSKSYDKKRREVEYEIGSLVLIYTPAPEVGLAKKLMHFYKGPYKVVKKKSPNVYYVESLKSHKIFPVPIQRMKPYLVRSIEDEEEYSPLEISFTPEPLTSYLETEEQDSSEDIEAQEQEQETTEQESTEQEHLETQNQEQIEEVEEYENELNIPLNMNPKVVLERLPELNETREVDRRYPLREGRRQPSKFSSYYVNLLLTTLCIISCVHAFTPSSPILWRNEGIKVVSGLNHLNINLRYFSVCKVLNLKGIPELQRENIQIWCRRLYKESFIEPIKTMCRDPLDDEPPDDDENINKLLTRNKREITTLTLILLVGGTILGGTVLGSTITSALGLSAANKLKPEVERLIGENEHLSKRIEEISNELKDLAMRIEENQVRNIATVGTIFDLLPTITSLSSSFLEIKLALNRMMELKRNGRFNIQLLQVFNLTLPCHPNCDKEVMKLIDCQYLPEKNLVTFKIITREIVENLVVLKADPFSLTSKNDKKEVCLTHYLGPTTIIYNKEKHSFCLLNDIIEHNIIDQTVILPISCSENLKKPDLSTYWKTTHCSSEENYIKEKAVQIKTTDKENYVYCKWNNITLFNQTSNCPPFVFAFTNRASFKINNVEYISKEQKVHSSYSVMPDWILNLNRNLMSLTPHHQIERITQQPKSTEIISPGNLITLTIAVFMTIFHLSIYATYWCFKNRNRAKREKQRSHQITPKMESLKEIQVD